MSLRWKKRAVAAVYHLTILVMAIVGVEINEPWLVWIGILDALTFKMFPVARYIQSKLITSTTCAHCHKQISLVDNWQCACGYICQVDQHVFSPCTQCGKIFTFLNCEHCGMGVLV